MSHPERRSVISPIAACGIIMGILLLAAAPPLGVLALLFAVISQSSYGRKRRGDKRAAYAKATLARERQRAAAIRYMRS